ncbi:putative poxc laccase transcription factor [Mycena venus]|uniref:Putative poxc laccase transcription factor n=1 Tax=Mycena venus TaxID=2733690 RepID=A0A8H6XW54_9AGAR|nr:putative poxc laccase transcription factor [Mycena venus]
MALVACSPLPSLSKPVDDPPVNFIEAGPSNSCQSMSDPFTAGLILRTHSSDLRLYCTVPTWSSSSDTCLDLHDLHQLRTKFLVFIHDLVHALRSSGAVGFIRASAVKLLPVHYLCWRMH